MEERWKQHIDTEMAKDYFVKLRTYIKTQQANVQVYPENNLIFNAFELCPYYDLKVVILGTEPHTNNSAHGLAWSVQNGSATDSLYNVLKEIKKDIFPKFENTNMVLHKTANLTQWAQQGVLLLNILLTSEKGKKEAHKNKGWEEFASNTIKMLSDNHPNRLVFMLWGKTAQEYGALIDREKHLVLETSHPNPYTEQQGFMGCKHFSQANDFISKHHFNKLLPIKWHLF